MWPADSGRTAPESRTLQWDGAGEATRMAGVLANPEMRALFPATRRPPVRQYEVDTAAERRRADAKKTVGTGPRHLRTLFSLGTVACLSDAQLLEQYIARRDELGEAAFATLVQRHGPMVLGACRRVLADRHTAEDAFQATFLVLAHKARSIARRRAPGELAVRGGSALCAKRPGRVPCGSESVRCLLCPQSKSPNRMTLRQTTISSRFSMRSWLGFRIASALPWCSASWRA